ncbi:MAG: formimidoylglutamate deiminase [Alphaproteobacteria bacterium]|nr:formimidoylglutamate deiminase [Alphaproteobacteria bacterium]
MRTYLADEALLPEGWARDVAIDVDGAGAIVAVRTGAQAGAVEGAERLRGPVLPGLPNLHSHAFQRAMAGRTERRGPGGNDSFWTWREVMYRIAARFGPEDAEAVAAQLYVEMLKGGYTAVAEFHYLHHAPDGRPYADRAEMARRILAAARRVGIGITMLPSLYRHGGFGEAPPAEGQRRFLNDAEGVLHIVATVQADIAGGADARVGLAPHSLRAVSPALLADAVAGMRALDPEAPIHIHVAEQLREVEECLAATGRRPVARLLELAAPDARWCAIHATHMDAAETAALAASGAVAGLCPLTEANLGDGLFPFGAWRGGGGRWGIGSDSQVSASPRHELRQAEYAQRLHLRARTLVASEAQPSPGTTLLLEALDGGAQALGRPVGAIAPGRRADLLVLDAADPWLAGASGDTLADAFVFAGDANSVRDVMVGGRWVVRDGHHADERATATAYRASLARLFG